MSVTLPQALETLRAQKGELRRRGVLHASVFGSVARGEARDASDVDVLVELDPDHPVSLFDYARLKIEIGDLFGGAADVVNCKTLKPLLRDAIIDEAVNAF